MELQTISQVSKVFNISTRTLRYYEQIGLLPSVKKDDYTYRTYDEASLLRLQQIVVLRKLRIPLKQISDILKNEDAIQALDVFRSNLSEVEDEITALSTIKSILNTLISHIHKSTSTKIKLNLLGDEAVLKIIDTLTVTKINFKEEKSMEDLNQASQSLSKLKNVRIVYLPPATVASYQYIGDEPEMQVGKTISDFVHSSGLVTRKPDLRHYGFNNPNPIDETGYHGYEMWVTIPDDLEVSEPLVKKHFAGGLYGAHCIKMGNFEEWQLLYDWVGNNEDYTYDRREPLGMDGCIEEHFNSFNQYQLKADDPKIQLDLLIPIKEK